MPGRTVPAVTSAVWTGAAVTVCDGANPDCSKLGGSRLGWGPGSGIRIGTGIGAAAIDAGTTLINAAKGSLLSIFLPGRFCGVRTFKFAVAVAALATTPPALCTAPL